MVHYAVLLLESVFFIGLAGSLVVAILAFVGDIHVFLDKDKPEGQASLGSTQRSNERASQTSSTSTVLNTPSR
jgi:hypothetical protein